MKPITTSYPQTSNNSTLQILTSAGSTIQKAAKDFNLRTPPVASQPRYEEEEILRIKNNED